MSPASENKIIVLHGPNLNSLGEREPDIYGSVHLEDLNRQLRLDAEQQGFLLEIFQSNHEGELIDAVHKARTTTTGLIINGGGYSHTSIAIRDALSTYPHPAIEVHLSNVFKREPFRHHSYISEVAAGVICGFGVEGYRLALDAIIRILKQS